MRKVILQYGIIICLLLLSGGALMHFSHGVQHLEKEIKSNQKLIDKKEESIRVLKAEWAYLNSPQRLEKIAKQGLGMSCPAAENLLSSTSELPQRRVPEIIDISYGRTP